MPDQSRPSLTTFWRNLPSEGRWLLSTVAIQTFGRGLTLPFMIVYLNERRGFDLGTAGLLMSLIALTGVLVTPSFGTLIDKVGARHMVILATIVQMIGSVALAFAASLPVAAFAMVCLGIAGGISWPAFNTLVASIVDGPSRQQYFAINFALVNLGIGLGGAVSGWYVEHGGPDAFTRIYLADAASMLVPLGLMLGPLRHVHGRHEPDADAAELHPPSYLAILRRPAMASLMVLTFVTCFVGYGQMEAGFPAFARGFSEVSKAVVGYAFALNTVVIVTCQFAVIRRIQGHRRTRVFLTLAALWALAWITLGATQLVTGTGLAIAGVMAFHTIFALGETMLQPTIPAVTNDLAPDHLRGRYNAAGATAFQVGAILGPLAAGLMLHHRWGTAFIAVLVLGCGLAAVVSRHLEGLLTPEENGVTTPRSPIAPSTTDPAQA